MIVCRHFTVDISLTKVHFDEKPFHFIQFLLHSTWPTSVTKIQLEGLNLLENFDYEPTIIISNIIFMGVF